ncbi:MAG: threonine synthase [bacterium]|nr:threonine synthase [bacterium]
MRYLCPTCGANYHAGEPLRGVLEAEFDYESLRLRFDKDHPDWSLLCAVESEYHPPFPVGNTPLFPAPRLSEALGFWRLFIKNDSLNPTGSLKDRASALVVAEANRLGEDTVVTASTGNAGVALAAACAAGGKHAIIFAPAAPPPAKLTQMLVHGAKVVRVRGTYDDAYRLSLEFSKRQSGLNRNTGYHPLTIEGKKSVAIEIFEQMGMLAPDAVVIPVGDGVILSAVHKGFCDLRALGLISTLPRLIAAQAESSDAIHHFVKTGKYRNAAAPKTFADSISVSAPSGAYLAAKAIRDSGGFSVTVSDDDIRAAQFQLADQTGIFTEPAAAATLAALKKANCKDLSREDRIVLLITGHGLKNPESVAQALLVPEPVDATWDAVNEFLS